MIGAPAGAQPAYRGRLLLAAMLGLALSACGGDSAPTPAAQLQARLVPSGTLLVCDANPGARYKLQRSVGSRVVDMALDCPGQLLLRDDWTLSRWTLQASTGGDAPALASVDTQLPAPTVLTDGANRVVLRSLILDDARVPGLQLEAVDASGVVQARTLAGAGLSSAPAAGAETWRWHVSSAGRDYFSVAARPLSPKATDIGLWGALTTGGDEGQLFGATPSALGPQYLGYEGMGLGGLFVDRDFRDLRRADFNNDGLDDFVTNVYGSGCALIGLQRASGDYDLSTPRRADGSCIGGHGETILVADFDGDGWLDVLLPSYERLDFLHNLGDGRFVEEAEALGIAFPNYEPRVEGAAAVDLDLDGSIDIVIGNEVLLNDGRGRFRAMLRPFGAEPVPDEGLFVADVDGDGRYDIVKNDPSLGPRIFWGRKDGPQFDDSGWLFGGAALLQRSFGLTVGRFSGHDLPELVIAGGDPAGLPPKVCVQPRQRELHCLDQVFAPSDGPSFQDLLLLTDDDGDGVPELYMRFGTVQRVVTGVPAPLAVFRIDLRDAAGHRNQHGRSMRARCSADDRLFGLRFVDGGNGYMAQSAYIVPFVDDACPSIWLEVPTKTRLLRFGPLPPGTHILRLPAAG